MRHWAAIEMTEFLAQRGYRNVAPLLGVAQWLEPQAEPVTLLALFAHVGHQGDAWSYALNHLERFLNSLPPEGEPVPHAPHSLFNEQMRTLGHRVARMHTILAADDTVPAFAPEPVGAADLDQWRRELLQRAAAACDRLQMVLLQLPAATQALAREW